eukprot:TRINITY_DN2979_c0_g1_i2.p1 TRINITY_DN2979_c0_g1~~TRINITY_DN2979_c0_g1_i2.p1  ORF type:complete len:685 (-),score=208.09 TRINITY_DN2979_c0_g1_i2:62-1846(-)
MAQVAFTEGLSTEERKYAYQYLDRRLPFGLHFSMFVPTIEGQGTKEQKEKWLPLCYTLAIIGTYAQTELGHGSFIRGLETTATFDEATDEFVIHSPTLTSMKWWPGNLGKSVNFCVVMAQLIIKGKDYGLHAFIVQVRSRENHMPLPGITIGDIGPKYGYEGNDNGFLKMDHVRIPRDQMLMRHAKVDRQGNYTKPPHAKIGYATMVLIRASIVGEGSYFLAKAVTIATRYSVIRQQFFSEFSPKVEVRVIDYQTQQHKLFPLLAQAFMLHFTGNAMRAMYEKNYQMVNKGDLSMMPELHATSSCLKALSSTLGCEGMEICRKALGGHGYSRFSGIIDMYADFLPAQTYEGENTILYLQTARYLVKAIGQAMAGKAIAPGLSVSYLGENKMRWLKEKCNAQSVDDFDNIDVILHAFRAKAGGLLAYVALDLQKKQKEQNLTAMQAFETAGVDLCNASLAHAWFMSMKAFGDAIKGVKNASIQKPLHHLFVLLGTSVLEEQSAELLGSGYLSGAQLKLIRAQARKCLAKLRPDAVALVDSWDFSDYNLNSALGRYDGNVYEALYEQAKKSPLNSSDIAPGINEYLLPLMKFSSKL